MPIAILYLIIEAIKDSKTLDKKLYKMLFGVFYEDFRKKRIEALLY